LINYYCIIIWYHCIIIWYHCIIIAIIWYYWCITLSFGIITLSFGIITLSFGIIALALSFGIIAFFCIYNLELNPPVVHLDFKSPNVLIRSFDEDDAVLCQIADFGEAQIFRYEINRFDIHNPIWLAPERIMEKPYGLNVS
jgi:serine/threonine protein kinase